MATVRNDPWAVAVAHLTSADGRWLPVVERIGPCRLRPRKARERFGTLVRAIIGQQISTHAATAIDARLRARAGEAHEPLALLSLGERRLRSVGLSPAKARTVLDLAEYVRDGRLPLGRIGAWDDEAIVDRMTEIRGIGRWTAEMFLIFALCRPDVLPISDLGVRVAMRAHHGLDEVPKPRECVHLAEPWRPFRTVAMWYLWRTLDAKPPR
jgi:DNA-3-methyladenine glycosylase II